MGATLTQEIPSSDVPTIKDHGHRTKTCETLKRFLEGLVTKGHMDEYIKKGETTRKDYDDEEDEKPVKRPVNNVVVGLIEEIHGTTSREAITKNAIRVHIKRAQCVDRTFSGEVMSISAWKRS